MSTLIESYASTSKAQIDTLKTDAPFSVSRASKSVYLIHVEERTFQVAIHDGGQNTVLDFSASGQMLQSSVSVDARDTAWAQSITKLTSTGGGFHLEMMSLDLFNMVTPEANFNFRIMSGPARAYIAVTEVSHGVEPLKGPDNPREVSTNRKPRKPAAEPRTHRR